MCRGKREREKSKAQDEVGSIENGWKGCMQMQDGVMKTEKN